MPPYDPNIPGKYQCGDSGLLSRPPLHIRTHRKPMEAQNSINIHRLRIFPGNTAFEIGISIAGPSAYTDAPEPSGSSRAPTVAKNSINRPRVRILPGIPRRNLWISEANPRFIRTSRNIGKPWKRAEARNIVRRPRIRISPGDTASELGVCVSNRPMYSDTPGASGSSRKLTIALSALSSGYPRGITQRNLGFP